MVAPGNNLQDAPFILYSCYTLSITSKTITSSYVRYIIQTVISISLSKTQQAILLVCIQTLLFPNCVARVAFLLLFSTPATACSFVYFSILSRNAIAPPLCPRYVCILKPLKMRLPAQSCMTASLSNRNTCSDHPICTRASRALASVHLCFFSLQTILRRLVLV